MSMASPNCTIGDTFSLLVTTHEHNIKGAQRNIYKVTVFQSSALLVVIIASMFGKTTAATPQQLMMLNVMPVVASAASSTEEQEEIKVIVERNVPVPMRDGTILRADVHRPDRGGPYPVLVQRTQYGKNRETFNQFVKAGYIVVNQDIRGCFESEGTYESSLSQPVHDAEDGYDTVEWAARLQSSNGTVGTFGTSNPATRQWFLAPLCPPSLRAMSASATLARFTDFTQGSFRFHMIAGFAKVLSVTLRQRNNRPGVYTHLEAALLWDKGESEKWVNWIPLLSLPREVFEDETEAFRNFLMSPSLDTLRLDEGCKDILVPNLFICGWFDFTADGSILLFQKMVEEAKTDLGRKGSRIIIGPWTHTRLGSRTIGNIDFGSESALDRTAVQIRWFDYWLKGKQNGVDKEAPVRIFVMGDNKWRDEQQWPLKRIKEKILFITSKGSANALSEDGKLVVGIPGSSCADNYVYDPRDPVSSPKLPSIMSPSDQRRLVMRKDVLVYQTEPLRKRVEVTGKPVVELYASSSAPDTDWFVRLVDVYPSGLALDVSRGFVRARYRNGLDKPKLIKPGEVVKYTIRMRPTSNAFLPGHRIRLDITSSDFPNYYRNHNTQFDQNVDATLVVANQTIYHGGKQATRIILPWVSNPPEEEPLGQDKPRVELEKQTHFLHQLAKKGDIEKIKLLILKGAYINAQDGDGKTPLCYAVETGEMETIQMLVEAGADVNAMDKNNWAPLGVAAENNHLAIAEYLIAHGANVNPDSDWTPLQETAYSSSLEMAKLLIDKGADINAGSWSVLRSAISLRRWDMAALILLKGAEIVWEDEYGRTPLHFAGWFSQNSPVETLVDIGIEINSKDNLYEFTALHYAARFGTTKVAEVLIAHGADIRAKDKWDYEPIHWAAYHDRPEIIELLITKGVDVNVKTSLGQTPLELAIPRRNTASLKVLRKHGAKESEENSADKEISRSQSTDRSK